MSATPVYLTVCAACGAHPAASFWVTEVPQPRPFHCPRCRPGLLTGEEQLELPDPVVSFWGEWEGARWCVLEQRDAGRFLARRLGLPDSPAVERHVNDIRPVFSYQKLHRSSDGRRR